MNTGFVRPAVATVLTACGIETCFFTNIKSIYHRLQQYLPLAVLKRARIGAQGGQYAALVATVLTACGIETIPREFKPRLRASCNSTYRLRY